MHDPSSHSHAQTIEFPRETEGLPEAGKPELVDLADKDESGTFRRTIIKTENPERYGIRIGDYFV